MSLPKWLRRPKPSSSRRPGAMSPPPTSNRVPARQEDSVLFAWELGGGLGHIHRLLPCATELARRGYRIHFALRSKAHAAVIWDVLPTAGILDAPHFTGGANAREGSAEMDRKSPYSYADILLSTGYGSRASLEPVVFGWRQLIASIRPSLIMCDFSPTVILAAPRDIPVIHVGSGFVTPPASQPFLPLHASSKDGAEVREARVLDAIAAIRKACGEGEPQQVSDLFGWAECFACSLPELDPYRTVRTSPAAGTMQRLPAPTPLADRPFVFGYLAAGDSRVPAVLQSLARARVNCGCFIPRAPHSWYDIVEGTTVKIFDKPQPLPEILLTATAVLHHGGIGTTETALAMGRPQLFLPRYFEQGLTVQAVQKLGCGTDLSRSVTDIGDSIRRCLDDDRHVPAALRQALVIANRPANDVKATVVAACLKHLE